MYGLTSLVFRFGAPCPGVLLNGSAKTVSMSPATAWPVHDWPFWSRSGTPARLSCSSGRSWRRGRYTRSFWSNGSGSASVVTVRRPTVSWLGAWVLTIERPLRSLSAARLARRATLRARHRVTVGLARARERASRARRTRRPCTGGDVGVMKRDAGRAREEVG